MACSGCASRTRPPPRRTCQSPTHTFQVLPCESSGTQSGITSRRILPGGASSRSSTDESRTWSPFMPLPSDGSMCMNTPRPFSIWASRLQSSSRTRSLPAPGFGFEILAPSSTTPAAKRAPSCCVPAGSVSTITGLPSCASAGTTARGSCTTAATRTAGSSGESAVAASTSGPRGPRPAWRRVHQTRKASAPRATSDASAPPVEDRGRNRSETVCLPAGTSMVSRPLMFLTSPTFNRQPELQFWLTTTVVGRERSTSRSSASGDHEASVTVPAVGIHQRLLAGQVGA